MTEMERMLAGKLYIAQGDVIAVGNPCRVLRPINEEDRKYRSDLREEYRRSMEH